MKKNRLQNICRGILAFWSQKGKIQEEHVSILYEGLLDDMDQREQPESPEYAELVDRIQEMWHYGDYEKISPEHIFLFGGIWGGIRLARMKKERELQKETVQNHILLYKNKYVFFRSIHENPGIRHKELAKECGWSPSQLSQFIGKALKEGLVSYNRVGREKYYFLRDDGEQIYRGLEKQQRIQKKEMTNEYLQSRMSRILINKVINESVSNKGSRQERLEEVFKQEPEWCTSVCFNNKEWEKSGIYPLYYGGMNSLSNARP